MYKLFSLICAIGIITLQGNASTLQLGLVANYEFAGNLNDSSGNNHNLTAYTGARGNGYSLTSTTPTLIQDRFGRENSAVYLDGLTTLRALGVPSPSANGSNAFSWTGWFKTSVHGSMWGFIWKADPITDWSSSPYLGFYNGGETNKRLYFGSYPYGDTVSNLPTELDTWYFFAGVSNQTGERSLSIFSASGALLDSVSVTGSYSQQDLDSLIIGSSGATSASSVNYQAGWRGAVDDIRIYDRALTGSEIASLAVPEPSSLSLLLAGGVVLMAGRRLRRV